MTEPQNKWRMLEHVLQILKIASDVPVVETAKKPKAMTSYVLIAGLQINQID